MPGLSKVTSTMRRAALLPAAVLIAIALPAATSARTRPPADPPLAFLGFYGGGEHGVPERGSIIAADLNGHWIRQLTSPKAYARSPAWSPGARRIAYEQDGVIYVMDRNGKHRRRVVRGNDPRWSPNGKQLAFGGGKTIEVVDVGTRKIRQTTAGYRLGHAGGRLVAGRPDDRFHRRTRSPRDLRDQRRRRRLPKARLGTSGCLTRHAALVAEREANFSIPGTGTGRPSSTSRMRTEATRKRLIRTDADARASWSWDGHRIVYGVVDIRLLNLRTGARRKIDLRPCRRFSCQDLDWSRTR